MLRISVASIPAQGIPIAAEFPVRRVQPEGVEPLPVDRAELRGTICPAGTAYLFQGRLRGTFVHLCDRCLEPADFPFDLELVWPFEEGPPAALLDSELTADETDSMDSAGAGYTYQGGEIDLGPYVWEEMVLAAPVKYICNENCAGLCPRCGANRNTGQCACGENTDEAPDAHPGFAELALLYPEWTPREPEPKE